MAFWQTAHGGSVGLMTQDGVGTPVDDPDPSTMTCESARARGAFDGGPSGHVPFMIVDDLRPRRLHDGVLSLRSVQGVQICRISRLPHARSLLSITGGNRDDGRVNSDSCQTDMSPG